MPERRFTEEEARRVFAEVATRQGSAQADETGLSLAEMQEAAEASGLDPALVAAVVAEMSGGTPDEIPTFLGAPLAVRQKRVLPVGVDDDAWARIVGELRREFDTPGTPTEMGRQREWTSGGAHGHTPVHLTLTPSEAGSAVTLEQTIAKQSKGAGWILPGAVIPMVLLAAFFNLVGAAGPEIWSLPVLVAGVIAVVLVGLWAMWSSWARRTERQFARVLDRIEIAARDAARASGVRTPPAPEAPLLDLGALPDAPDSAREPRTRGRERS
ncbi:hypothetical protein [Rubricoccus marinus]|uniref:Uncharacterized protein n=1 Tax=Rubricoccus marinus TaxID=716817 RepID=A0A259U3D8_9BACT|nr:hypothetical protein [Rubricoccus marinus]OZC04348.1 hypothetical protein BSZ36_16005 [Rubricoccus marinus]